MHHIMTGFSNTSLLIFLLFISVEMALEKTVIDLKAQNPHLQEFFLNLSKGQEELKALLIESMTKKNPEDNMDDQLEQLQIEMATMKVQMMGKMVGQMALIQNLARGQEDLRALVNMLHQDGCNHMGEIARIGDRVVSQPMMRQEVGLVESGPFQIVVMSRIQQQTSPTTTWEST